MRYSFNCVFSRKVISTIISFNILYKCSSAGFPGNKQGKDIDRQASSSKGAAKARPAAAGSAKEKDGKGNFSYLIRLKIYNKATHILSLIEKRD